MINSTVVVNNSAFVITEEMVNAYIVRTAIGLSKEAVRIGNGPTSLMGVKDANGHEYFFSCRVGEILDLLRHIRATELMGIMNDSGVDYYAAVASGLNNRAKQYGISRSAIIDKFTRQLDITGDGASARGARLLVEAVTSKDHRFDDLLAYLINAATDKDSVSEIVACYLGIMG